MLNWYADQIMEQHNERVRRALEQYGINQALALYDKPAVRGRTLFWVGDRLVRWGRKLQARENSTVQPFSIYINAQR